MSIPKFDNNGEPVPSLPDIEDGAALLLQDIPEPPVLVEGLLHRGSKLVLGGASKTYKTWGLLQLGVCVAKGVPFWGRRIMTPSKVLYVNLEIDRAFFKTRLEKVSGALGVSLTKGDFEVWNLRGYCLDWKTLAQRVKERIEDEHYGLIIIDPIYKCLAELDENAAGDIGRLMNAVEVLARRSGAAVAIATHFSKGNQAAKESIDRISGSGVFARDPDSILTVTRHNEEDCFTVDFTLRNFPQLQPFCIRWRYPLLNPDAGLMPADLKSAGPPRRKVPTEEEFLALFHADFCDKDPRDALLSNAELTFQFKLRRWDKDTVALVRDGLERKKKLAVVRGLPRNQTLAGRPASVRAYEEQLIRAERRRTTSKKD
jgi:hypothetical protein